MKFKLLALSFLATMAMSSVSANAKCSGVRYNFFPLQNDNVTILRTVTNNSRCKSTFNSGALYRFTGITIAKYPTLGSLITNGISDYSYKPKTGARGNDQFILKVCAVRNNESGCSTLIYNLVLQ